MLFVTGKVTQAQAEMVCACFFMPFGRNHRLAEVIESRKEMGSQNQKTYHRAIRGLCGGFLFRYNSLKTCTTHKSCTLQFLQNGKDFIKKPVINQKSRKKEKSK
ncbi:MAG: hypothetical protein R3Y63_15175 [Eubacteriales bacterium]